MALAILTYEGSSETGFHFRGDIGTNSFYKYEIGNSKISRNGVSLVDEITHESALMQPEPTSIFDSSFIIKIPGNFFNNNLIYVQLISYKDANHRSPAFSEVLEVLEVFAVAELNSYTAPVLELSKSVNKMYSMPTSGCRSVSFNYKRTPVSRNQYWRALIEAASNIKTMNAANSNTKLINDVVKKATEKLQQQSPMTSSLPQAGIGGHNTISSFRVRSFTTSLSYAALSGKKPDRVQSVSRYEKSVNANRKVLPASLSSLLSTALQQSPGLFQANMDDPIKLINAVAERNFVNKNFAYNYFEKLLSDSGRKSLLDEFVSNGAATQLINPVALTFSVSNKLSIDFIQKDPIMVQGKPKFIYQTSPGIKLMLSVTSIAQVNELPIPKVIIQLMIKDSISMQLLLEKKFKLRDIVIGTEIPIQVTKDELDRLPKNKDLLISAKFVWQANEINENAGTFSNHFIFLTDGFVLKEMRAAVSEEKPLNDSIVHRNFWHKVWEGGGNNKRWELELDTKYLCIYKYDKDTNGRIETRMQVDKDEPADQTRLKIIGKMKTGFEVSPAELNKILPAIGNYPSLSEEQIKALMTDELENQMNQESNVRIELKGRKDERGVIWVYPELTIHEIVLQKITSNNENGQVTSTIDETVYFPRISSFHFIGAKTN